MDALHSSFRPPPSPQKYMEEPLNHTEQCFKEHKYHLVQSDLPFFRTDQVQQILRANNKAIEMRVMSCNPIEQLWALLECNIRMDKVHNVAELENRLRIHWTRLMCNDELFRDLASVKFPENKSINQ